MTDNIPDFPRDFRQINSPEEKNPAINLFGLRFFSDQSVMDLLEEFLLLLSSDKEIANESDTQAVNGFFPSIEQLSAWDYDKLSYYPKSKLNLKLFSFLGASRLETRHETHRLHCMELWDELKKKIITDDDNAKDESLILLSNLFLGFWGSGAQRTWCSQGFLPFCKSLLSSEIIWNASGAKSVETWQEALKKFKYSQHIFLARGGELLYLQLCNALRQNSENIEAWLQQTDRLDKFLPCEQNPKTLLENLDQAFSRFFSRTPAGLNELAEFINRQGCSSSGEDADSFDRKAACGWCPEESWRESYLFAVELSRILQAQTDIMETVELLQIACAMQLMRSLAAQSYRHRPGAPQEDDPKADGLNYRMFFSEIEENSRKRRDLSQQSLTDINIAIHNALRLPELQDNIPVSKRASVYKDADNRYGHKLFNRTGKLIGLIVPRRGGKARFVLTDKLLRFFVVALVPTQRMTLDHFKHGIASHFGFVFEEKDLLQSPDWANRREQLDLNAEEAGFLEKMLEASGMLVKLSDSCSMVKNPFYKETVK